MTAVIANGKGKLTGSFYVNSPMTENWEDFNVQDLVGYVDRHYRTLAKPEARGIRSHSMGGFGALHIAMRQPDEFSSENLITGFVKFESGLATLPVEEAEMRVSNFLQDFTISFGYAFTPNPQRHPPYLNYPASKVYSLRELPMVGAPVSRLRTGVAQPVWDCRHARGACFASHTALLLSPANRVVLISRRLSLASDRFHEHLYNLRIEMVT